MKFEFEDIDRFLEGDAEYEPPELDGRTKDLNLIMAAAIAVRVYDEMRRKATVKMSDAIQSAADAVEKVDPGECREACLDIVAELAEGNAKTLPLDMKTATLLTMTLVDNGVLKPPRDSDREEVDKAVKMSRMILMSMAGKLAEAEDKRNKAKSNGPA